jgi:hypothetical protein
VDCAKKARRKYVSKPSENELMSVLLQHNGGFTEVGRLFNTTDNIVRGWCKQYGMSCSTKDYRKQKEN